MGKSTVAGMFEKLGIPSFDSDASVHSLMAPGGAAFFGIAAAFPYYSYPQIYTKHKKGGKIFYTFNRQELGKIVFENAQKRHELEAVLHPLVWDEQRKFIARMNQLGRKMVVLDIPLLFETDSHLYVDVSVNVDAPEHIQRARVLSRPHMSEDKFRSILEKQMPSREKSRRADYTIPTGLGRAKTFAAVKEVIADIKSGQSPKYEQGATERIY